MIYPFLNFSGKANEAMAFYEKVFECSDKRVMRFSDSPPNPALPITDEIKDWVLHAEMTVCGTRVNFSDTQPNTHESGHITLSAEFETPEEVQKTYELLKEGGVVLMECVPQFFSPMYAWVVDKFGIGWQIVCRK